VSDFGPLGDSEGDDPFKGVPLFGDLSRMLQNQGPIAWDAARQLAHSIAADGRSEPNVDPVERIGLEQLARVAELHVGQATGRPQSLQLVPVTRSAWAMRSLDEYRSLFERLAQALHGDDDPAGDDLPDDLTASDPVAMLAPLMKMIEPMMLGMMAGSMVGHLAQRSFAQYDLPVPRPNDEVMVVLDNVDRFGDEWSLPRDDLRLWICLHEVAHHTVLGIPHVRDRFDAFLEQYLAGFRTDPHALENKLADLEIQGAEGVAEIQNLFADPEVLLGAIQTAAQRDLLPPFEALVAVVVGYVDHVMDHIGQHLITSYDQVTEALRRRRVEADPSDRFVERLFGLELTQATYDRGQAFVAGVVERAGPEGLDRLWRSARDLPTPADVDAPGLWLARIELPDLDD
jgi:putative hydrolase